MTVLWEAVSNQLVAGILMGMIYALWALGLNLVFGVMRVISAAHGDLLMLGVYLTITIGNLFGNPLLALPVSTLFLFLIGFGMDRSLFLRLRQRAIKESGAGLILTLGLSMIISNAILLVWGPDAVTAPNMIAGIIRSPWISIATQRVFASVLSGIGIGIFAIFLKRTQTGIAIRAVAQDPKAAQAVGIDLEWINSLTLGLSVALAAAAGSLVAPLIYVIPAMGFTFTVRAWQIIVIGGLGSMEGAFVASILLGVVESLSILVIPVEFKTVIGFLAMIIVLLFKPSGLLGKEKK